MNDSVILGRKAEELLIRRIETLRAQGASEERTAFLETLLGMIRRYLAGERGELGKLMSGKVHYNWGNEDKETNGAVFEFVYSAEDEYEASKAMH